MTVERDYGESDIGQTGSGVSVTLLHFRFRNELLLKGTGLSEPCVGMRLPSESPRGTRWTTWAR